MSNETNFSAQDESSIVYPVNNTSRKGQFPPRIKIPLPSQSDHLSFSEPLIDYIQTCDKKETILQDKNQTNQTLSNCIIITSAASPTSPSPMYQDDTMEVDNQPNLCALTIPEPPKVELPPPPPPPPQPKKVLRRKLTPSEGPSVAELAKLKELHKPAWDILEEVEEEEDS